jgi:hypothetical protein
MANFYYRAARKGAQFEARDVEPMLSDPQHVRRRRMVAASVAFRIAFLKTRIPRLKTDPHFAS